MSKAKHEKYEELFEAAKFSFESDLQNLQKGFVQDDQSLRTIDYAFAKGKFYYEKSDRTKEFVPDGYGEYLHKGKLIQAEFKGSLRSRDLRKSQSWRDFCNIKRLECGR